MDWLTRLPWIGPLAARLMRTHAWRAYETLDRVHWTRLAAAITFVSFVALFPLVTVAAAIGAAVLSERRMNELEQELAERVPGISGQLDLSGLVDNAATVGSVAGALLLLTGIGWVGSLRECLRAVWELDDETGNPVLRKLKDGGVLMGLGGVAVGSFAVSTFAVTAIGWTADQLDISGNGVGGWLLRLAAFAAAVAADFLLMCYVLTLLPSVHPPRRQVLVAALIGAVGFEGLKLALSGYLQGVAAKSMYGAFGVPIALLLWINLTAKLTLYCAAWTATGGTEEEAAPGGTEEDAAPGAAAGPAADAQADADGPAATADADGPAATADAAPESDADAADGSVSRGPGRPDAPAAEAASGDAPGTPPRPTPPPNPL
ncbi:YihY/virulence factor BrkB family protein [Streptomyces sp. XD-27]|uniref:YihY/virulence factor BrkB family protein n=1 Tax=Streptomyces sp. XD-27 TaxID=3062779 RepID=UPI0026F40AE7|nr:YihY/virulence factor BrkB family protein [Streptomyces sp. XD-27]WKX70838.1 YihY/virulence factor BrkB family protein [Streptomyces sp. XD-27]